MAELHTSYYTIYVDLPQDSSRILLVHGYTGAFDMVSTKVGTYLRGNEVHRAPKPLYGAWTPDPDLPFESISLGDNTIDALRRRGYLTDLSFDDEVSQFRHIADIRHQQALDRSNFVFMPTYDCNLRCFYCFQDHLRTDPANGHLLGLMTKPVIDRIFRGIEDIESRNSSRTGPRNFGLFGGEPLLRANRSAIEYIVGKAQAMGPMTMWAISNATELEAYADLLGPEAISSVQITLDGPPAEHDKRRIHTDGTGSFAAIARNIDLALDTGVSVQVRMNIDRVNIDQLPTLARVMHEHGWAGRSGFVAYTYPIHAVNAATERSTTFSQWDLDVAIDRLREEHPEMAVIDRPDERLRRAARQLFNEGGEPHLRAEYCSAHSGMYIFDAFGDIYACWERTGEQRLRIGRVDASGKARMNLPLVEDWRSRSVATVNACTHCRYALHCGGGCAVLAEGKRGTLHANYCDGFANRFRAMVAEAFLDHEAGVVFDDVRQTIAAS